MAALRVCGRGVEAAAAAGRLGGQSVSWVRALSTRRVACAAEQRGSGRHWYERRLPEHPLLQQLQSLPTPPHLVVRRGITQRKMADDPFHSLLSPEPEVLQHSHQPSRVDAVIDHIGKTANGVLGRRIKVRSSSASGSATDSASTVPVFKFVHDEQVAPEVQRAEQIIAARKELAGAAKPASMATADGTVSDTSKPKTLSVDPEAASKRFSFVFVDTSKGHGDNDRSIVVRETDGTLRTADAAERDRFNQKVFPHTGKRGSLPAMFDERYFGRCLTERHLHATALDIVSRLRQPHQPDYVRIHRAVYDDVDARGVYSLLQDTPHWAGFAAYLLRSNRIDNLVLALVQKQRHHDAANLVQVLHAMHSGAEGSTADVSGNDAAVLTAYAQTSPARAQLTTALQAIAKGEQNQPSNKRQQQQRGARQQRQPRNQPNELA
eukprot:m.393715 g.393715  ORF g.393715 m.393715 type:complete len:436 (+) comp20092_c0_seq1:252-1559(+)